MIKAEIEYKDGTVERKTFHGISEYSLHLLNNASKVKISHADSINPSELRQGKYDKGGASHAPESK